MQKQVTVIRGGIAYCATTGLPWVTRTRHVTTSKLLGLSTHPNPGYGYMVMAVVLQRCADMEHDRDVGTAQSMRSATASAFDLAAQHGKLLDC